ncbi:MAG: VCBS repeat-containing protein [Deltaproteobacteria bacterium]|nr:VCBS repeat-containing protein [Deltaproteobacteria bacterium]
MRSCAFFVFVLACVLFASCGQDKGSAQEGPAVTQPPAAKAEKPALPTPAPTPGKRRVLLVTESQFKTNANGQYTVPDKGAMLVLTPESQGGFTAERVEDEGSNVMHKAMQYGNEGILSIGGNAAALKMWNKDGNSWRSKTLWSPTFGGKQNRLRDFEQADFDGDGRMDLAIATHDQGVVAVVWRRGDAWVPEELDRTPDTFVHEIEVGDLDGNGKLEIYATPSQPNRLSGEAQGGRVMRYAWNGKTFDKSVVAEFATRHVKEILVADLDKDGRQELYASLEAEMLGAGEAATIKEPVEILRFDDKGGKLTGVKVATLPDRFCRFLTYGDLDGDGKQELVASAFSSGVWVMKRKDDGTWEPSNIDKESSGFEHAAFVADLENDGRPELYVADDGHGTIVRYEYANGAYVGTPINRRMVPSEAMVWNITMAEL